MSLLESTTIGCPCCGELVEIEIDCSAGDQTYVEDCPVCCRPLVIAVAIAGDGSPSVSVRGENE